VFTQSTRSRFMSDVPGDADKLGSPSSGSCDVDHWYTAREALTRLYGEGPGFSTLMGDIARCVAEASAARGRERRVRDDRRRREPHWFARPGRPAYCAYADRFAGTLGGCIDHIPYLSALNVGLVHLTPAPQSDLTDFVPGEVRDLARALRFADIGLVLGVPCDALDSANSSAFRSTLDTLLDLANAGADGFELIGNAAPRDLVAALRHLIAMAAPGVVFLDEASPACRLACNTTTMAGLWAAIAEGDGAIFDDALWTTAARPADGLWLNYARNTGDIIWGALDRCAGTERQKAWTRFYAGGERFAEGLALSADRDGAGSVCGMAASLCGVPDDAYGLDRLKLVYSVVYALDGVPMIYMGDEIALANDADFATDAPDMRGLHRPHMDWDVANAAEIVSTPQGEMFNHLRMLSEILMAVPGMDEAGPATPLNGRDGPVLAFARALPRGRFLCIANLSDDSRDVRLLKPATELFYGARMGGVSTIPPWTALWLHEY